jgi:hypothetical protein
MNWAIPRDEVVETALATLRAGWNQSVEEAAAQMLRLHYRGISPAHARGHLERDLRALYHAPSESTAQMAQELLAEGWRLMDTETGWLWIHERTRSIPSRAGGGAFTTYHGATQYVFQSATREMLK